MRSVWDIGSGCADPILLLYSNGVLPSGPYWRHPPRQGGGDEVQYRGTLLLRRRNAHLLARLLV